MNRQGSIAEHISYPTARGAIDDRFASAVFGPGVHAMGQELLDDLALCGFRRVRAAATAASILHREVKRRRTGFVSQRKVTAGFKQASHRLGATGANSAVQRSGAILVLPVDPGAGFEQAADSFHLLAGAPRRAGQARIRRIMQRAALTMVRA